MAKLPVDAPLERVLRALVMLGFEVVRAGNHVSLSRLEADGRRTPLTLPHHRTIKGSTLRTALTQTGISREEFLKAWERL
ncbi:MAG: type II toxin-antitoxin system HicA family toxin [Verrucomicrobia bacterium]|nr:type II toxin-antitoxin system HicA family toxin [Verrucomicrobiota bacterium]